MKLTKETLAILKNFTQINSNFAFKKGNTIQTMSEGRNLIAEAQIPETLSVEFGVFNLSEFLGVVSLYDDPDLEFSDKLVTISENSSKIRYMATDISILRIPKKGVSFESLGVEEILSFTMSADLYSKIVKTSAILRCPDIWFVADGKKLSVTVNDIKNTTSNDFSLNISDTTSQFKAHIKIDTFKFINGSYDVSIAQNVIRLQSPHVTYYVMAELDSEF